MEGWPAHGCEETRTAPRFLPVYDRTPLERNESSHLAALSEGDAAAHDAARARRLSKDSGGLRETRNGGTGPWLPQRTAAQDPDPFAPLFRNANQRRSSSHSRPAQGQQTFPLHGQDGNARLYRVAGFDCGGT